jgi:alkanesulfonate monooxygenase SsuD/methylene tetrahydromethanopterin reductase-like flavin-dependent oxidoreductase (luciferase family)
VRLGINVPTRNPDGTPPTAEAVQQRAREIEEAGFDGIWIGDTVHRGTHISPDPLMWLLTAALATRRVELGVAVLQLPLRQPFELAQRLATMNALTQGRFTLGVGAGSTRTDFDANRVDYEARFKILTEYLPIIRKLSNGEQVGSANLAPWTRPGGAPRILIGAWANGPWVRRAAREYDGWLASGHYTRGVKALADGIKRFRDAGGKRAVLANVLDLSCRAAAAGTVRLADAVRPLASSCSVGLRRRLLANPWPTRRMCWMRASYREGCIIVVSRGQNEMGEDSLSSPHIRRLSSFHRALKQNRSDNHARRDYLATGWASRRAGGSR